jgi:ubiquinone/menaquinone biosynthesis C-methylase UbiE
LNAPSQSADEVEPGTGYYTLDVAEQIVPDGVLDILDLQQEMLDHTMRKVSATSPILTQSLCRPAL